MSTVNGAYGPAYPEPLPPPPPPPPPPEPAPEVKADDPNASADANANTNADANLDTQKEDQNTAANDQVAQPPTTTPVKTDTIETKGVVDTKVANVAEAKSKAQTEFAQSLTEKIVAAAPKDVASTPEFRTGAETLAKQTASEITNSVSAKFPENAPPELLYQTIKTVGSSTEQAAPALAQLVQNVNQARTESNTTLAQQGYDSKQLASNSSVPVTKTQSAPINTTSLSNPNIVSDANPKTIIADVSGKDNTGQDVALTRTYSKAYEQSISRGQSPEEANKQGWSAVQDGILPLRTGSPTVNVEYKGASVKTDGKPAKQDVWEVRANIPLFRLPAYNGNLGVTYTNNDTNVVNTRNPLGNIVATSAEMQARNPINSGAGVILGQTGATIASTFAGPGVAAKLTPHLTTHSLGVIDMGNSDAGRYDAGRISANLFNTDIRIGVNNDKGFFAKVQVEHSVEAQALSIQNRSNEGAVTNYTTLFGKLAAKGEPLSTAKPTTGFGDFTQKALGLSEFEASYGSKIDTNAPLSWAGLTSQNPDYFLNGVQGVSGGKAGPTSVSIGRDGTAYDLNDPTQKSAWSSQFKDVPLLIQSMRGSDKDAEGSQLFMANPRTYLNLGKSGENYQTSDQGWGKPNLGERLSTDQINNVKNDSEDKNADFGDWVRGVVTKPLAWASRTVDERRPNELAVEKSRDNAGLPQGLKPIESTVAELNYVGATQPKDLSALASVTQEQLIALNPDKVSYVERPNATTGQKEKVAAFKEGESLILPVATSRTGELQMLRSATGSDGNTVKVPDGKMGTTHVKITPEDFYRKQVDFANAYNRVVDQTMTRYKDNPEMLNTQLDKLSKTLYGAKVNSNGLIDSTETVSGGTRVTRATVELGNENNRTPLDQLGDRKHSNWVQQQLEKAL
jgi:hypothetical protein